MVYPPTQWKFGIQQKLKMSNRLRKCSDEPPGLLKVRLVKITTQRLNNLGMTTLEERRRCGDMIQTYKIINNFSGIDKDEFFNFVKDRHNIETRSVADDLLVPERCNLNVRKNFFACRVVNDWNSLPSYVRESESVNSFKNNYDDFIMESKIVSES